MSCIETMHQMPATMDSEMEEGEIVDELDELSDISSEEEFLLRQRLQVLENYNNVLERKKAKGSKLDTGTRRKSVTLLQDLSEISESDLEDSLVSHVYKSLPNCKNQQKHLKVQQKPKKKKVLLNNSQKNYKRKASYNKKKLQVKIINESSDESEDEYRNKRRKLANAVVVTKNKVDKTSLKARLNKMLHGSEFNESVKSTLIPTVQKDDINEPSKIEDVSISNIVEKTEKSIPEEISTIEYIDLCSEDKDDIAISVESQGSKIENSISLKNVTVSDSDEDLELLRQNVLKTKSSKTDSLLNKPGELSDKPLVLSEEDDSDTAELRLICLKSALLKKAIEMKQKQKVRRKLSQSTNLQDELEQEQFLQELESNSNNTDIESVDMDIGSDGDEKTKDLFIQVVNDNNNEMGQQIYEIENNTPNDALQKSKDDEIEEDEDLLRAKLLTSLTKNLPNLVDPNVIDETNSPEKIVTKKLEVTKKNTMDNLPKEKRFIITLGESDSEAEHEATKNLTKMHMKLSEQADFQLKLDQFLKSTRMEVEMTKLPDVVQKPPEATEKFVPKPLNSLPKSEQLEYKNLVKRMAELERLKQSRQLSTNVFNQASTQLKETLKPRNVTVDAAKLALQNNLEEQIALSRKKIAEESAKMLKLKEESVKLTQKYKIAATELRNITTAINFNKKEQRIIHNKLSKIRIQHQLLLKNSKYKHSKNNILAVATNRLQKENDPSKEEYKDPQMQKLVKICVTNDLNDETRVPNERLSIQVDVSGNKKTVKIPSNNKDRVFDVKKNINVPVKNIQCKNNNASNTLNEVEGNQPTVEKGGGKSDTANCVPVKNKDVQDYRSPLDVLSSTVWDEDPNAFFCPYEVGGNCKDTACKYVHPKIPTDPKSADPKPAEPESAELKSAEPRSAESKSANQKPTTNL